MLTGESDFRKGFLTKMKIYAIRKSDKRSVYKPRGIDK